MTVVDTNILLDVLIPDAPFGAASQQSLDMALQPGRELVRVESQALDMAFWLPQTEAALVPVEGQ